MTYDRADDASPHQANRRAAFDQASLRAHIARSRVEAADKTMRARAALGRAPTSRRWTIPNAVPLVVAASFALMPLVSSLGAADVLRHFAVGFGVLLGGLVVHVMTRGAFGAGVLKLGAALSVWVGGGEPLAMFVATSLILPLPLALASGLWNRHMRGDPDGGFSIPYWPTMLLAFTLIAPRTDVGLALARAWS